MNASSVAVAPHRKRSAWSIAANVLYLLLILIAAAAVAFVVFRPITVLPRITLGPGYALTDANGEQFTSEALRGTITLYTFTYTSCAGECESTTPTMAAVQNRLGELNSGDVPIQLVTISVDPADTPPQLQSFAATAGANPGVWTFLTGTPERVRWVVGGGFSIYYQLTEVDNQVEQLTKGFVLVDGAGLIRAEYRGADPDVDALLQDMSYLVDEAQNSEGPIRLAYEAAHLFGCYPR